MKRTPLKRKTELSRSTPLGRGNGLSKPSTTIGRKAGRASLSSEDKAAAENFALTVTASGRCAMCGRPGRQDAHHVLPAKLLKKLGLTDRMWDVRNGIPLGSIWGGACSCHEHHETRHRPIPRSVLPIEALEFAREIDQEWRLERLYPAP